MHEQISEDNSNKAVTSSKPQATSLTLYPAQQMNNVHYQATTTDFHMLISDNGMS